MEDSGLAFAASIFHSLFLAAFRHLKDGGKPVSGVVRLCFGVDGHAGGGSLCVSCLVSSLASRRTLDIGQGTVGYAADVCAGDAGQLVLYGLDVPAGSGPALAVRLPVVDGVYRAFSYCAVYDVEPQPATEA